MYMIIIVYSVCVKLRWRQACVKLQDRHEIYDFVGWICLLFSSNHCVECWQSESQKTLTMFQSVPAGRGKCAIRFTKWSVVFFDANVWPLLFCSWFEPSWAVRGWCCFPLLQLRQQVALRFSLFSLFPLSLSLSFQEVKLHRTAREREKWVSCAVGVFDKLFVLTGTSCVLQVWQFGRRLCSDSDHSVFGEGVHKGRSCAKRVSCLLLLR